MPEGIGDVVVPQLVGLSVSEARRVADEADVLLTSAEPDGPPLSALTWSGSYIVTAQRPPAGERIERHGLVEVEFMNLGGGGGESGDREPREPEPPAGLLVVEIDEPVAPEEEPEGICSPPAG